MLGNKLAQQFVLDNLAFIYYRYGRLLSVRAILLDSRGNARPLSRDPHFASRLDSLKNAGDSAFQLNDLTAARDFYQRSLNLAIQIKSSEKTFDSHQALGYLLLHTDPSRSRHPHPRSNPPLQRNATTQATSWNSSSPKVSFSPSRAKSKPPSPKLRRTSISSPALFPRSTGRPKKPSPSSTTSSTTRFRPVSGSTAP